ncbi:MAG: TRAP transporter large permease [Clostridia bacterium]|nr:TRAP transporter large permease [Clostridia bacterium]
MAATLLLVSSAVLLFIGVPIGVALAVAMLVTNMAFPVTTAGFVAQSMFSGLNSFPLLAIPGFMIAGSIMETGGLSKRLVKLANTLVGNSPGGLGTVTVLACMFFGAVSGSAPATVAAIGTIMIPEMVKHGYDKVYATALVAAAGGLGIIVPPSIPMVVYGCTNNVSVGSLFMAGFGPALVVGVGLMIVNWIIAKKKGYRGSGEATGIKAVGRAFWDAKWALLMPAIILGGIYGGVFTPTEAAIVSLFYGLIIGLFVYKELSWREFLVALKNNTSLVGGIMLTFAPASALGAMLSLMGVPARITSAMLSFTSSPGVVLFLILVFLLLVGMVMTTSPAIIIFSPMLLTIVKAFGMSPVQFGIIMTVSLAIGFVTPPVALNLFVASGMTGLEVGAIAKKATPFIVALFVAMAIITYVPGISIGLLRLVGASL